MEIIELLVKDLIPYENNPRRNDEAVKYVANSIKEFGFKVPIVIDKDNVIIAGHTRLKAAKKLGFKKVPCIIADDLTEEQIKAFRLADNKTAEMADWDLDMLNFELGEIDFDMSQFGFDIETDNEAADIVEDEIPETPKKAKSKLGQIYQLGEHRLMCGDSTNADDVANLMNGVVADISFTSPPYNADHLDIPLSNESGGRKQKATEKKYLADNDKRTTEEYVDFLKSNIELLLNNSSEVFYNIGVASGSKIAITEILYIFRDYFKDLLYWKKQNPMPVIAEGVISSAVELIIAFGNNNTRSFDNFSDRLFHGVIDGVSASATMTALSEDFTRLRLRQ